MQLRQDISLRACYILATLSLSVCHIDLHDYQIELRKKQHFRLHFLTYNFCNGNMLTIDIYFQDKNEKNNCGESKLLRSIV